MKNLRKASTKTNASISKFAKNQLSKAASKAVKGGTGDNVEKVEFIIIEEEDTL